MRLVKILHHSDAFTTREFVILDDEGAELASSMTLDGLKEWLNRAIPMERDRYRRLEAALDSAVLKHARLKEIRQTVVQLLKEDD